MLVNTIRLANKTL